MAEEEDAGGEERPSMAQFSALTTYSDLITLMASFFLLMFMIALQEQSKAKATMETVMSAIARQLGSQPPSGAIKPSPGKHDGTKGDADLRVGQRGDKTEVMTLDEGAKQKVTRGNMVLFQPGMAELSPEEKAILKNDVAPDMKGFDNRIEIQGYAADSNEENGANPWELSYARAYAVMYYLVHECGMEEKRFHLTSYGSVNPLGTGAVDRDRRVEIIMSDTATDRASGQ